MLTTTKTKIFSSTFTVSIAKCFEGGETDFNTHMITIHKYDDIFEISSFLLHEIFEAVCFFAGSAYARVSPDQSVIYSMSHKSMSIILDETHRVYYDVLQKLKMGGLNENTAKRKSKANR